MQHPSISETTDANLMARFVPIAPRAERHSLFPPGKKYDTPDFVSTVISMRQKLYELQGDSLSEEPTQEKDILKRWKASNSIIHGNVNVSTSFFRECKSLRMVLDFTVLLR